MKYVKDIMSSPVVSVSTGTNVQEAAKLMAKMGIGSVAVKDGERFSGILTERDISKKIVAQGVDASSTTVDDIMETDIVTAEPDATIGEASTIMDEGGFRRLPIMEDGVLRGIVTETDLELALREEAIEESKARVRDHYKFAAQIRRQELRIEELKRALSEIDAGAH